MKVVLVVGQTTQHLRPLKSAFGRSINCLQALNSFGLLRFIEEARTAGGVRKEEKHHDCKENGGGTLYSV